MQFLDNVTDRVTLDLITKSMSDEDIEKSMGRSGLVQVQRTITKKGKTFTQMYWVKPDQIKEGDHVVRGDNKVPQKHNEWDIADRDVKTSNSNSGEYTSSKPKATQKKSETKPKVEAKPPVSDKPVEAKPTEESQPIVKESKPDVKPSASAPVLDKESTQSMGSVEKEFKSVKELEPLYNKQWMSPISDNEEKAFKAYTRADDYFWSVNFFWRGMFHPEEDEHNYKYFPEEVKAIEQVSEILDSGIAKSKNDAMVVHRIVGRYIPGDRSYDFLDELQKIQESGGFFQEHGYMSTSLIQNSIEATETDVVFKIHLPEGEGIGAYIEPLSPDRFKDQHEFLMGRGGQFKILSNLKDREALGNPPVVELEWVGAARMPFDKAVSKQKYLWTQEDMKAEDVENSYYNRPFNLDTALNEGSKFND